MIMQSTKNAFELGWAAQNSLKNTTYLLCRKLKLKLY